MKVIPADNVQPGDVFRPIAMVDRPYAVAGTAVFDRLERSEVVDGGRGIVMHGDVNGANSMPRFHPCEVFE